MSLPQGSITDPHVINAILALALAFVAAVVLATLINARPRDRRREPPDDLPRFPMF